MGLVEGAGDRLDDLGRGHDWEWRTLSGDRRDSPGDSSSSSYKPFLEPVTLASHAPPILTYRQTDGQTDTASVIHHFIVACCHRAAWGHADEFIP